MGTRAFVLPCNQLADKADLTGARLVPYTRADGTETYKQVFYPHQVIQECIEYAEANPRERPLLFLDEINRTTSDVTSGALTLVTLRRMGHVTLPANVRLLVAGNDRGNVTALDEASLSRFVIVRVEPDAGTLMSVLGDALHPWVRKVLTQFPNLVFQKSTPTALVADGRSDDDGDDNTVTMAELFDGGGEEMNQLTTPRTIDNLSRWLSAADRQELASYLATPVQIGPGRRPSSTRSARPSPATRCSPPRWWPRSPRIWPPAAGGATPNQITVPKPTCYPDLKAAGTVSDLETLIAGLTQNEISGSLVFALREHADNTRLLEHLAQALTELQQEHLRTLLALAAAGGQLNRQNQEALFDSDAPVVDKIQPLLAAFL